MLSHFPYITNKLKGHRHQTNYLIDYKREVEETIDFNEVVVGKLLITKVPSFYNRDQFSYKLQLSVKDTIVYEETI